LSSKNQPPNLLPQQPCNDDKGAFAFSLTPFARYTHDGPCSASRLEFYSQFR
jgi:hypothetical protein